MEKRYLIHTHPESNDDDGTANQSLGRGRLSQDEEGGGDVKDRRHGPADEVEGNANVLQDEFTQAKVEDRSILPHFLIGF